MDEENISRITVYFQNNIGQSNDILIRNLRQAGYTENDINEACRRMGIRMKSTFIKKFPMMIAIVIILLFIVGVSSYAAMKSFQKPQKNQVLPTTEILPTTSTTKEIMAISPFSTPIDLMKSALNTKNFKIIVKNIRYTGISPDTPNSSSSIVRTTLFVLEHGKFVRFEDNYPQANQYAIFKDGKFYMIDNQNKRSYYQSADSSNGRMFYESAEIVFMPYFFITAIEEQRITWQELSETHWKALWRTNSGDNNILIAEVDSRSHLPTLISMQAESDTEPYEKYEFSYEEIPHVDDYTSLPQDYALEEFKL